MKIEDVVIEDAADANYVIKKFFNNDLKNIKMDQLEQLVITVYNLGKNKSASAGSESSNLESAPAPEPVNPNPFKANDKAKVIEDIEMGQSGEFINTDTVGTITSVNGEMVTFLFEFGEDGEMIENSVLFSKLEKIS